MQTPWAPIQNTHHNVHVAAASALIQGLGEIYSSETLFKEHFEDSTLTVEWMCYTQD